MSASVDGDRSAEKRSSRKIGARARLLQVSAAGDPVQGLQLEIGAVGSDAEQIVEEALALLEVAQSPKGAQHVVRVAQPTVPVVPGSSRARRLGNRGGGGRDDGPGVLEAVQLERQRRADHLALEERRDVAVLDPPLPVAARLVQEAVAQRGQRFFHRLAPGEHEVLALGQGERLPGEVGRRHIGGESYPRRVALEFEVVASPRRHGASLRPTQHRLTAHPGPRQARDRLEHAHQHGGLEHAPVHREPRSEIGDPKAARLVGEGGLENVGVLEVPLNARFPARRAHREGAPSGVEQFAKQRLGVEAWKAAPDDLAVTIDEGRVLTVADETQILETHAERFVAQIGLSSN